MTTDNKTLADVQPGGMVRLGGSLPPLPCTHYNACGDGSKPLYTSEQMRDYALSAQPSPGGQGAPRDVDDKAVRQFLADRAPTDVHREEILSGAYDHTLWFDHIRELMTALAARQPVGQEPVGYTSANQLKEISENGDAFMWRKPGSTDIALYAAPPAQAVDLAMVERAMLAHVGKHATRYVLDDLRALIDSQAVGK